MSLFLRMCSSLCIRTCVTLEYTRAIDLMAGKGMGTGRSSSAVIDYSSLIISPGEIRRMSVTHVRFVAIICN